MGRPAVLSVINAARSLTELPNGTRINTRQKHTLVTLATYYPHIFPGQSTLARDMSISRRQVSRRMLELERANLVTRVRPKGLNNGSTRYKLNMQILRPRLAEDEPETFDALPF